MAPYYYYYYFFFTRGRYDPSGDAKIRGALFLEWLVFTDGFVGGKGATEGDSIEVLDGHR